MTAEIHLDVAINQEAGDWPSGLELLAEQVCERALEMCGYEVEGPVELSILLTDDAAQQRINAQWRGKDKPTNVLSFPAIEFDDPIEGLIGDLSLACETVQREADEQGISFEHHFAHLVVHGLLHCLGFDHENDEEALVMEGLETQILASMGIADPYAGG